MNKLMKNSNLIAGLLALAHLIIGVVTVIVNNLKTLEMYRDDHMAQYIKERIPTNIISSLIFYLPVIFFVIYIFFLYKKKKNHQLLIGALGFSVAFSLWNVIGVVQNMTYLSRYGGTVHNYFFTPVSQEEINREYLPILIVNILLVAIYILFIIDVSTKFKLINISKILSVVMLVALCIKPILNSSATEFFHKVVISNRIQDAVDGAVSQTVNGEVLFQILTASLLGLAFAVFWWLAVPYNSTNASKSELKKLQKKFESGKIDEQTYQEKRAEILEKI